MDLKLQRESFYRASCFLPQANWRHNGTPSNLFNPQPAMIRIFLACVLVLSQNTVRAQEKPVLRLVGDNWCPYNCDPRQGTKGYMVDLLNKALGADYRVDYALMPWTRALQAVQRGERDILLATTPGTTPNLLLSQPMGIDRTCFFIPATTTWTYRNLADLSQKRIGVIQDYKYDNDGPIDRLISRYRATRDPRVDLAVGDDALGSNFRKLLAGRMDVVLENELVGAYTIRLMGLGSSLKLAGCDTTALGTVHVAMSPKSKQATALLAQIDTTVRQLRETKALAQILQPYGITDWQPLLVNAH